MRLATTILLLPALSGCSQQGEGPPEATDPSAEECTGKCDSFDQLDELRDIEAGPVGRCTVALDESTDDPFFQSDEITCDFAPRKPAIMANAATASGVRRRLARFRTPDGAVPTQSQTPP